MSYARVVGDAIISTESPPDLLEPGDITAQGRWWDLRRHDHALEDWEANIIGPHGWLPVVSTPRPPDTATDTYEYSVQLVDGVPTETWTQRPWTQGEIDARAAQANVESMRAEQDVAVAKLLLAVESLNELTGLTNATINGNPAAAIKEVARALKTVARVVVREARLTSGRTESAEAGTEVG